jgi:O-antigen/teichoic acid export membrane protein
VIVLANLLLIANNTFLQGMQYFFWLGFIPAANVLLRMACCGLLAGILGYGLSGALIAFAAATMICVFLGASILISLTPQTSRQKPALPTFPYALIPPVTAAMFGLTSMTQIDLVLVNRYFNPEIASQYALAAVLGKAVLYLPTGLVSVILPVVAAGHARQQSGSQQAWQAILATLGLAGGAAVGCSFLGPWFVAQLYGEKYGDAGRLLAFYGPAMVPMGVALVTQVFVVAKGRPLFSWIIAATAICEIGMLNAWHPSLEAVLATIAVFNTGLAILGTILVKLAPNDRTVSTPDEI